MRLRQATGKNAVYEPPLFREDRVDVMHEVMRAHPFATLVSNLNGRLTADHLPLVIHPDLSEKGTIRGHIAKANPLWRDREHVSEVLAIFQGPQAYVTPSWYASKKEHGKVVPTWNYVVVHAHGHLNFMEHADWILAHLKDLTGRHESHRPVPWQVSDAPADYVARQIKGIVGIEVEISELQGKRKLSQNRSQTDRVGVERGLRLEPDPEAAAMADLIDVSGP